MALSTSAADSRPAAVELNQRDISSVSPFVSNTNLAGTPSRLQRTHAIYWLYAHGGGRVGVPVLVMVRAGRAGVLLQAAGGSARVMLPVSPLLDPPLAISAHVGEGEGGGGGVSCWPVLFATCPALASLDEEGGG